MTNTPFFDFVNQKHGCTPLTNTDMGGWEGKSTHIQLENLSQKEAELILAGKENWMVTLVIVRLRLQTMKHWVHLCIYSLICFESINQNLWS